MYVERKGLLFFLIVTMCTCVSAINLIVTLCSRSATFQLRVRPAIGVRANVNPVKTPKMSAAERSKNYRERIKNSPNYDR